MYAKKEIKRGFKEGLIFDSVFDAISHYFVISKNLEISFQNRPK